MGPSYGQEERTSGSRDYEADDKRVSNRGVDPARVTHPTEEGGRTSRTKWFRAQDAPVLPGPTVRNGGSSSPTWPLLGCEQSCRGG